MIKNLNSWEMLVSNSVKIQSNPGATTTDLLDHVKSTVRKKSVMLIIHTGTNDHGEDHSAIRKVKKFVSVIKEIVKMLLKLLFLVSFIEKIAIAKV